MRPMTLAHFDEVFGHSWAKLMAGTDVANGLDSNQTEKVVILAAAGDFDSS